MADELGRWAAGRADALVARAEAEAVAELKRALLDAVRADRRGGPVPSQPVAPASAPAASGEALWAYCVAHAGSALPEDLPGVHPGHRVVRVEHDGLAALVSAVPLAEFGEAPLRQHLNDLSWLERVARSHEWVLEQALDRATIVPLRLCTIFGDERGVARMLAEQRADLTAALESLSGTQEWAVKLVLDRAALEASARGRTVAAEQSEAELAGRGSGAAYLLRRRQERHVAEAADRLAAEIADDVHGRIQEWSVAAKLNPPQNRELSGHEGEMVLNGAYLVSRTKAERLRALVAELQDAHRALGAELVLTGPLPPYNFVPRPDDLRS